MSALEGFLFGYILGSPNLVVRGYQARKPETFTKAQQKALAERKKHDLTCPNLPQKGFLRKEMESIFY